LLPTLLPLQGGLHVLDACAAPGGKTCALLEAEPSLDVLCLDKDERRLARVHENLDRCGLTATVMCGDITTGPPAGQDAPFDIILLDAPCSATGVIRRHPDIKLLRSTNEVDELVATQAALLDAAWPLLKPGGHLLYSTCSVLKRENCDQIDAFLKRQPSAAEEPLALAPSATCTHGVQLFPSPGGHDGFYYALLRKC
jgi:16S rRNA (cytosine967-C5)-methyltransferase